MLILSQDGLNLVNMNLITSLSMYNLGKYVTDVNKQFRILAWYGTDENDCIGLGDYQSEERCKEIFKDIWKKYGEYYHRPASPAILKGSVDLPELIFEPPKTYEMPEE